MLVCLYIHAALLTKTQIKNRIEIILTKSGCSLLLGDHETSPLVVPDRNSGRYFIFDLKKKNPVGNN